MNDRIKKIQDIFKLDVKRESTFPDSNSSDVYLLTLTNDQKVILKVPYNSEKCKREIRALKLLAGKLPVPQILNSYIGDDDIPSAMLLSYIDGKSMAGVVSADLAFQMGELLARLHSNTLKKYGSIETEGVTDEDRVYINNISKVVNDNAFYCEKVMEAKKFDKCMEIFNYYFSNFPALDGPCLVHTDFRMGNILVNDSKIVGLIDFEVAHGGSADSDFTLISNEVWNCYDGTKESFLEGYKTIRKPPDIEKALPFYEFYTAFTRIGWCIKRNKTHEKFYLDFNNQIDMIIEELKI